MLSGKQCSTKAHAASLVATICGLCRGAWCRTTKVIWARVGVRRKAGCLPTTIISVTTISPCLTAARPSRFQQRQRLTSSDVCRVPSTSGAPGAHCGYCLLYTSRSQCAAQHARRGPGQVSTEPPSGRTAIKSSPSYLRCTQICPWLHLRRDQDGDQDPRCVVQATSGAFNTAFIKFYCNAARGPEQGQLSRVSFLCHPSSPPTGSDRIADHCLHADHWG